MMSKLQTPDRATDMFGAYEIIDIHVNYGTHIG